MNAELPINISERDVDYAMKPRTIDEKIDNLSPGGSFQISESNGLRVVVERSGDGKTLRFVRESANGFQVFKSTCLKA